jgi:hypothetical protein
MQIHRGNLNFLLMNSNPTRKKRRVRKTKKTSPKRFAGQTLKGAFEWADWSFPIKALTERIGLEKCWEAIPVAIRLVALKKRQLPGKKIPEESVFCMDADSLGLDLVLILLDKLEKGFASTEPDSGPIRYLESLGKALDALVCRPTSTQARGIVTQCYAKARSNRLIPPTSKMVEDASLADGSKAFPDATSNIRKKIKKFDLKLTPSTKIRDASKLAPNTTQAGCARIPNELKRQMLEILGSPVNWPLADLYEGIIWKTCPSEIFEIQIYEKKLWEGLKRCEVFRDSNSREEAMDLMRLIQRESFQTSGKVFETSLGAIQCFARRSRQTTFRKAEAAGKFKEIPQTLTRDLRIFLEESLIHEVIAISKQHGSAAYRD